MGPSDKSVSIRVGIQGDDQVDAAITQLGDNGDKQIDRLVKGFGRMSDAAEQAAERARAAGQRIVDQANIRNTANSSPVAVGGQADAQIKAYNSYMADQARQAEALRNAIEPLRVAQAAYDRELGVANSLLRSGNISEAEHATAVRMAGQSFDEARRRLNGLDEAHGRASVSGQIMQHVVRSTTDSFAAGLPVSMIFGEQISRLGEAAAYSEGSLGAFGKFMAGPWGLAVNAAISVSAVLIGKFYSGASAADTLAEHQKALADILDRTTGRVKEQSAALLLNQQILAMGDVKDAQRAADAARRAIQFHGETAIQAGTVTGSAGAIAQQSQLDPRLKAALDLFQRNGNADDLSKRVAAIGNATPALRGVTNEIIAQASAYTEATRKAAQYQAQVRLEQGRGRAGDAKIARGDFGPDKPDPELLDAKAELAAATNAQQRAEAQATITRLEAKKALDEGTISEKQYLAAMTGADKAIYAADAAHKALTKSQREQAAAARELAKLGEHMERMNIQPIIENLREGIHKAWAQDLDDMIKDIGEQRQELMQPLGAALKRDVEQHNALAITKLELDTIGMAADKRQVMIDRLAESQRLQQMNIGLETDQAKNILDGVSAQDAMNAALAKASATMEEVKGFAGQLLDDLTSGRDVSKDLLAEFQKLAIINPLKNLLSGTSSLPTMTSATSLVSKLLGGGSLLSNAQASSWASANAAFAAAHNASGTDYFGGGLTWVAENGPELIKLPRGSQITPAAQTRRALAANDRGSAPAIHFHLEGAVLTQDLVDQMNRIGQGAAVQGAFGGGTLGEANIRKSARRQMR